MTEATAAQPAPRPPGTSDEQVTDLLEANLAALADMAARIADVQRTRAAAVSREVADALTAAEWRVADCQGGLRDLQQAREREARLRTVQEMFERATAPLDTPARSPPRVPGTGVPAAATLPTGPGCGP